MNPIGSPARKRSYDQYCGVARGLDIVGERWTLLIARDLLLGPKRYKDLLEALPGIGTNLLAARLRALEVEGLVRRTVLPPPAGTAVYELTELGLELEPVIMALGRWGHRFLGLPRPADALLPGAFFIALRGTFRPEEASVLRETYEFHVGNRVFEVRVDRGRCVTSEGAAHAPDAVITIDIESLGRLLQRVLTPEGAIGEGVLVEGDQGALTRFVEAFAWRERVG
jgi:DNA-binding HxlR family transcriptional regulator